MSTTRALTLIFPQLQQIGFSDNRKFQVLRQHALHLAITLLHIVKEMNILAHGTTPQL